jgi:hypothetical protein
MQIIVVLVGFWLFSSHIYIRLLLHFYYVFRSWSLLWSSGQSSWLQTQRFGFDSWCYQIFWEVVGLERSLLSFVSTIEELLDRKVAAPVQKAENMVVRSRHADHVAPSSKQSWH